MLRKGPCPTYIQPGQAWVLQGWLDEKSWRMLQKQRRQQILLKKSQAKSRTPSRDWKIGIPENPIHVKATSGPNAFKYFYTYAWAHQVFCIIFTITDSTNKLYPIPLKISLSIHDHFIPAGFERGSSRQREFSRKVRRCWQIWILCGKLGSWPFWACSWRRELNCSGTDNKTHGHKHWCKFAYVRTHRT